MGSSPPVNDELALLGLVLNPIKLHVNGLGPFLFDGVVGESNGKCVVDLHGSRRLWMHLFLERLSERNGLLTI